MINRVRVKVCGLTSAEDAVAAEEAGADYLGFIFYPKSPRHAPLANYLAIQSRLPARPKVAVCVEPSVADLTELAALRFDFFQLHFNPDTPMELVETWAGIVGASRLWLAPRLPHGMDLAPEWLRFAGTFLLDTFHADKPGGTGQTGDWVKFNRHRDAHPEKQWILSGGLSPENIGRALAATGADFIDVNSGVEQSPGVKSATKLRAFALALRHATRRIES